MKQYLLAGLLAVSLAGCSSTSRQEARNETEQTRARAASAHDDYTRKMQERLDRIDREIDEEHANARSRKMDAKARRAYDERMAELERMRKDTRVKYNDLRSSGDSGWDKFRDDMDSAADRLDRAWKDFKADLKGRG